MQQEVKETIETVLDKLALSYERVEISDERVIGNIKFEIVTEKPGICIGNDGEHLRAIATIIRKIIKADTDIDTDSHPDFFIDVGGYKTKKIQEIQRVAYTMAGRAKTFEKNVELEPMNAYERMIVHKTLEDESNVSTESTGSGKQRRVVVYCTK